MRSRQRNAVEMFGSDTKVDTTLEIGGRLEEMAQQTNLLRLSLTVESAKPGANEEQITGLVQKLEDISRLISDAACCTESVIRDIAVEKGRFH